MYQWRLGKHGRDEERKEREWDFYKQEEEKEVKQGKSEIQEKNQNE